MEFETGFGISDAIPEHWMVVLMDLGFVGYLDLLRQPHGVRRFFVRYAGHSLDVSVGFGWVSDAQLSLLFHSVAVLRPMATWNAYSSARRLTAWCQQWYQGACVGPNPCINISKRQYGAPNRWLFMMSSELPTLSFSFVSDQSLYGWLHPMWMELVGM